MFAECGINSISSQSNNIVSAHFMSRPDSERPVLRVVMSNQWIVRDILDVSRDLKGTCYNNVYLSNDRSKEEREKRRLLVTELKSTGCPKNIDPMRSVSQFYNFSSMVLIF